MNKMLQTEFAEISLPPGRSKVVTENIIDESPKGYEQNFKLEALREHDYLHKKTDREIELEQMIKVKSSQELKLEGRVRKQSLCLDTLMNKLRLERQKKKR